MTPQFTFAPPEDKILGACTQSPPSVGDAVLVLRRPTTDLEGRVVSVADDWVEVRFFDGWSRVYRPHEVRVVRGMGDANAR